MNPAPRLFVDTVYLLATFDEADDWSNAAREVSDLFARARLVTTEGVISEFLASCSRTGPNHRARAVAHVRHLKSSPRVEVVELTTELVNEGIAAYSGEFLYTRLSLQDCISILVMRQRGISEALTADREFTLAGINVLMQAPSARR